jgi:short-subunit dehydrogenase
VRAFALRPVDDQVIVVTGATSGIGLVTAKRAAAFGARVVLVARNERALGTIVREIEAEGGTAAYAVADVGDAAQVEAAARYAVERFGRIDTWVNNAGVAIYAMLADTPIDEHQRLFRTNYFGTVNGCTAALRHLRELGGALITIGSIASDIPSPVMGAYAASKHAVKAFVESLRIELAASGAPVSVTLIKPSGIDTPIAQHAANHTGEEALIPAPVYDPILVADAILDAAVTPSRELTVGGVGRAQVLLASHFPKVLEAFARTLISALTDPTRRPTPDNNLSSALTGDRERSGVQSGRRFSVYASVTRHRALISLSATAFACGSIALLLHRRDSAARRK